MITDLGWDCLVLVGDCLKWLPEIPSGSINLTVTDPPYESLERHRSIGTTTRLTSSWFECFKNVDYCKLFGELYRVHAENSHCYVFCDSETEHVILSGRNPYNKMLDQALFGLPLPKGQWTAWPTLTWIKTKSFVGTQDGDELEADMVSPGMGYHWRRSTERIMFFEKGKRKLQNLSWPDTLLGSKAGRRDFPTQKPHSVLGRLIQNSSSADEIVLDPFAGSGSTAVVALRSGRRAILIEKNPSDHLRNNLYSCNKRVVWKELP